MIPAMRSARRGTGKRLWVPLGVGTLGLCALGLCALAGCDGVVHTPVPDQSAERDGRVDGPLRPDLDRVGLPDGPCVPACTNKSCGERDDSCGTPCGSPCDPGCGHCGDGTENCGELGVDCGGEDCAPCPSDCTGPDGATIVHGASKTYYLAKSVPCTHSCEGQARTCDDGVLSGSYAEPSCTVAAPQHEICNNGMDDDCDGAEDCSDSGCSSLWSRDSTGQCVPGCVVSGTCTYGVFEETTLNGMATAVLAAQKLSYANDGTFNFAVISDPHIFASSSSFNSSSLKRVLDALPGASHRIALVVITGDLVDEGTESQLQGYAVEIQKFMASTAIPVFSVPGNHDIGHTTVHDATRIRNYLDHIGDPDYDFAFNGARFLVTNSVNFAIHKTQGGRRSCDAFYEDHGGDREALTNALASYRATNHQDSTTDPSQYRWAILDDQLTFAQAALGKAGTYHFGFTHTPVSGDVTDPNFIDEYNAAQYQAYEDLFATKGGAVFSGHLHVPIDLPLGSGASRARNIILDDCKNSAAWALVRVTPQQATVQRYRCGTTTCWTQVGAPIMLAP